MRPALLLMLATLLQGGAPKVEVRADLLIGPGRQPPPGVRAFQPRLTLEIRTEGLPASAVPEFRVWKLLHRGPGAKAAFTGPKHRLRVASVAPTGPGRYVLQVAPDLSDGPGGEICVGLWVRGRRPLKAIAPIQVRALPAPPPPPGPRGESL